MCLNSLWMGRLAAWVLCCLLKILLLIVNVIGWWVPSPEQWVCLFAPLRICFAGYWVPLCNALPSTVQVPFNTSWATLCVCVEGGGRVGSSVADPLAVRAVDGVRPRGWLSSASTIVFYQVRFPVLEDLRHFTLFDSFFFCFLFIYCVSDSVWLGFYLIKYCVMGSDFEMEELEDRE